MEARSFKAVSRGVNGGRWHFFQIIQANKPESKRAMPRTVAISFSVYWKKGKGATISRNGAGVDALIGNDIGEKGVATGEFMKSGGVHVLQKRSVAEVSNLGLYKGAPYQFGELQKDETALQGEDVIANNIFRKFLLKKY